MDLLCSNKEIDSLRNHRLGEKLMVIVFMAFLLIMTHAHPSEKKISSDFKKNVSTLKDNLEQNTLATRVKKNSNFFQKLAQFKQAKEESWTDVLNKIKPTEITISDKKPQSQYEWRPIVADNEKHSEAKSFLIIDWKAIIHYACTKKMVLVPLNELDRHLEQAKKEMPLSMSKENSDKIINFTTFNYAVQNSNKDIIISSLKEYDLELSLNQKLVVDDFFAQPQYERTLPLYLDKNKHDPLKTFLDIFAQKKYDDAIEMLGSRYKQSGDNSLIGSQIPISLFSFYIKEPLRYCFLYLMNNEKEIVADKECIEYLKEGPKNNLDPINALLKDIEKKITLQTNALLDLKAVPTLYLFNRLVNTQEVGETLPKHTVEIEKIIKECNQSIDIMTNTIQKNNKIHTDYIDNHRLKLKIN